MYQTYVCIQSGQGNQISKIGEPQENIPNEKDVIDLIKSCLQTANSPVKEVGVIFCALVDKLIEYMPSDTRKLPNLIKSLREATLAVHYEIFQITSPVEMLKGHLIT